MLPDRHGDSIGCLLIFQKYSGILDEFPFFLLSFPFALGSPEIFLPLLLRIPADCPTELLVFPTTLVSTQTYGS